MMFHGSRNDAMRMLGLFKFSQFRTLVATLSCLAIASAVAFYPEYEGLSDEGHRALFILVFAAGMWISEAIPAFATSLLVIGLLIALLGSPRESHLGNHDWEMFIQPWGSSLIWLFFGGFCLAESASKTGLDRWLAARAIGKFGNRPAMVLIGVMIVTAVLSMFVSNTATATLVLAMLTPLVANLPPDAKTSKALMLGVAFAANLGGMGTIIGTPPNAIAAGLLTGDDAINFAQWMLLAVPPAILLLTIAWAFLTTLYLGKHAFKHVESLAFHVERAVNPIPQHKQLTVIATFVVTVGLWITSPLHNLPTTVVSFIPITVLTGTGILNSKDIRNLPWDILLLITGGLALGVGMKHTGLATWTVDQLPLDGWSPYLMVLGFAYTTIVMSNLMSNTATANLILPIAIAVLVNTGNEVGLAVPIALAASAAMCLPISTPPNAIVYSSGHVKTPDLLISGLLVGIVTPPIVVAWSSWVLPMID